LANKINILIENIEALGLKNIKRTMDNISSQEKILTEIANNNNLAINKNEIMAGTIIQQIGENEQKLEFVRKRND
jgi:hypothetical protein